MMQVQQQSTTWYSIPYTRVLGGKIQIFTLLLYVHKRFFVILRYLSHILLCSITYFINIPENVGLKKYKYVLQKGFQQIAQCFAQKVLLQKILTKVFSRLFCSLEISIKTFLCCQLGQKRTLNGANLNCKLKAYVHENNQLKGGGRLEK